MAPRALWNPWAAGAADPMISSMGTGFFCPLLQCSGGTNTHGPHSGACVIAWRASQRATFSSVFLHVSRSCLPLTLREPLHRPPWVAVFHTLLLSILLGTPPPFHQSAPVSLTLSHPLGVFPLSKDEVVRVNCCVKSKSKEIFLLRPPWLFFLIWFVLITFSYGHKALKLGSVGR